MYSSSLLCLITLFYLLLDAESSQIHRLACRRAGLFKATDRNKKISKEPSNSISVATTVNLADCAVKCTSDGRGRSFNFKKTGTNNCQIMNIDKGNGSVRMEAAAGWSHYELVSQVCIYGIYFVWLPLTVLASRGNMKL